MGQGDDPRGPMWVQPCFRWGRAGQISSQSHEELYVLAIFIFPSVPWWPDQCSHDWFWEIILFSASVPNTCRRSNLETQMSVGEPKNLDQPWAFLLGVLISEMIKSRLESLFPHPPFRSEDTCQMWTQNQSLRTLWLISFPLCMPSVVMSQGIWRGHYCSFYFHTFSKHFDYEENIQLQWRKLLCHQEKRFLFRRKRFPCQKLIA